MKKLFLTAVAALFTLGVSAQFMVVTTYDNDQEENMDKITANMGIGFVVNDNITVGLAKGTPVETITGVDTTSEDGYDLFVRYNLAQMEGAYAALQMPTNDGSDNMQIGVGFSFNLWQGLYVEPNYMMPTSDDANGKREGTFNFGLSYRF